MGGYLDAGDGIGVVGDGWRERGEEMKGKRKKSWDDDDDADDAAVI